MVISPEPFHIAQGTRQGSIWSPFMYTIYINELLTNLCQSLFGLKINNIPMCAPNQADDIVLLSLTKDGLNEHLNICCTYAHKWRYRYNAFKCAVLEQSYVNHVTFHFATVSCKLILLKNKNT